ncbi:DUF4153 domain-containing protein [Streptomyces sp. NPDC087420]|uniref:DUF4153 domain-containing protein n=1 Tax=Streptomyces sp. NPDC087420 TaxID=3365785 RepID=UPI003837368B
MAGVRKAAKGAAPVFRARVRRLYGESPLHLLVLLTSFVICCYAGVLLLEEDDWGGILIWFVGAAVLHDLVLVPLYALLDRGVRSALGRRRPAPARKAVNYVRVPAAVSLLLLLVYWPLVTRASPSYEAATGLDIGVFLGRWLLITAALFVASALWLGWRTWYGRRTRARHDPPRPTGTRPPAPR